MRSLDRPAPDQALATKQRIADLEATPMPRIAGPTPIASGPFVRTGSSRTPPASTGRIAPEIDMAQPVRPIKYAALFGPAATTGRDELAFAGFLHALEVGDSQTLRQLPRNANTSSTGADGAFAVGGAISPDLTNSLIEQSVFMKYCRVLPLQGQSVTFPVLNELDRTKGPGLVTAERVTEGVAATRQTLKFREVTLVSRKEVTHWSTSSEMLQDTVPGTTEAMVTGAASTHAMYKDRQIRSGTGVGQALGVINAPCTIVHPKDGGQSASTVTYTNLSGMVSRLLPSIWNNAIWVLHPSTMTALFGVYLATGASGGIPLPLSQGADGGYRLFGRPIIVSDFAAPLSSLGDIALVDLSYYVVGLREDIRFEVSRDFLFSSDEVAYKMVTRGDSQPILSGPVTPARGSTTLSPFVVLEAR